MSFANTVAQPPALERASRLKLLPALPDVAKRHAAHPRALDRVGMEKIHVAIRLEREPGVVTELPAEADAFVRLDRPEAKGIHMSRLFLALDERLTAEPLRPATLAAILDDFATSHRDLSRGAYLNLRFELMLRRPALRSAYRGWKRYPIQLAARVEDGALRLELETEIPYSSTCPCSAALSRQRARDNLLAHFGKGRVVAVEDVAEWVASEAGMPATPHSQRSYAEVRVALDPASGEFPFEALIDHIEGALGTPVQAAVKREDEQAFAELNGANLMFCEDAARRLAHALDARTEYLDFRAHIRHEESLHAHDAVSAVAKGVPGGFRVE